MVITNKSAFIRSHLDLKPSAIMELAKKNGTRITASYVYIIRAEMRKKMRIATPKAPLMAPAPLPPVTKASTVMLREIQKAVLQAMGIDPDLMPAVPNVRDPRKMLVTTARVVEVQTEHLVLEKDARKDSFLTIKDRLTGGTIQVPCRSEAFKRFVDACYRCINEPLGVSNSEESLGRV